MQPKVNILTAGPISPCFEAELRALLEPAGLGRGIAIDPLPLERQEVLQNWDGVGDIDCFLFDTVPELGPGRKLLWSCGHKSIYRDGFLKLNADAMWGCSDAEHFAVEYSPAAYRLGTQIHETLHLFGVGDCYDVATLEPLPDCALDECVMRYGGNSTVVCSSVIEQLSLRQLL